MSLYTHNEICRYCKHVTWHRCCDTFCRCEIGVTPDFVRGTCAEKETDVRLSATDKKAEIAMCWKCTHSITIPLQKGSRTPVGCKEMSAEQWDAGWNKQSGNQDGCPLLRDENPFFKAEEELPIIGICDLCKADAGETPRSGPVCLGDPSCGGGIPYTAFCETCGRAPGPRCPTKCDENH